MMEIDTATSFLVVLHYVSPFLAAIYFLVATAISFCRLQSSNEDKAIARQRTVILGLLSIVLLTYVGEGILYVLRSLTERGWWAPQHAAIHVLAAILVWGCLTLTLMDSETPTWQPYFGSWIIAGVCETTVFVLALTTRQWKGGYGTGLSIVGVLRVVFLIVLSINGAFLVVGNGQPQTATDEESQSLLGKGSADATSATQKDAPYGTIPTSEVASSNLETNDDDEEPEDRDRAVKEQQRKRLEEQGGWWGYLKGFSIFLPYLWPSDSPRVQGYVFLMGLCLVVERFINVLAPRQLGILTGKLASEVGSGMMPWKEVGVWVFLRWLGSSAGLSALESLLTTRIQAYSNQKLNDLSFKHIMNLSMNFHNEKDTGELLTAINQANSLNDLLELVIIDTSPIFIDVLVAVGYVYHLFDAYVAFILVITEIVYTYVGIRGTFLIRPARRSYVDKSREQRKQLCESISNWQTVSYFNRTSYEQERYAKILGTVINRQTRCWDLNLLSYAAQSLVMTLGLLSVSFLAVYRVTQGTKDVGSFVTLVTYWGSLSYPLNVLSSSYRRISEKLIDAERLLQLMQVQPTITDKAGATELKVSGGEVRFEDVCFAYDSRKQALSNVDFTAEPGKTVALVGETGGGKSTTLKLLFRFYDVTSGSIKIDGQDIRDVTLSSLREALGVVPQDPALFNQSIMDNVRYARLDASDEEVINACKAAAVHDKIESFPDKYKSKVGERGVKLSGGELQRVSIARVILKNPQIVLLDEATSAVDSSTEAQIQEAFKKLSAGRTTFVIAHRLSTIMDADLILVIENGKIIERGTHDELLRANGKYVSLWNKQTKKVPQTGSAAAQISEGDLLLDDLPPGTYSAELAKSFTGDNDSDTVTQVDGQSESKPSTEGSRRTSSGSIKKRIHEIKDKVKRTVSQGKKDMLGDEASEQATEDAMYTVSPRPTYGPGGDAGQLELSAEGMDQRNNSMARSDATSHRSIYLTPSTSPNIVMDGKTQK